MRYQARIRKAQKLMGERGLDVLFIVGRENLIYFTGTTQIECMAVLIPREGEARAVTLWLDAHYVGENSGLQVEPYFFPKENLVGKAVEWLRKSGFSNPRIGFEKYFVEFSVYEGLRQAFPESNFVNAGDLLYRLRAVKEPEEVEKIRQASRIVRRGMEAAVKAVRPGVSELEVLAEAEYAMRKAGSEGPPFRPQVVSGPRVLLSHPHASHRVIRNGEVVVIHLGATFEGYCSKMCRTVALGRIADGQERVYRLLLDAQQAAIEALRPGINAGEVDAAARRVVEKAGYGENFLDFIGYGVGLRQSEFFPIIGKERTELIEAGMVVDLLLPTIYQPAIGGPRVTDVIYIGEKENEILTTYPRELIYV
ncbi:MAG: Xaa-Pro dipeptidase [Clostridia bacterium]|nr:Xaa-Pro dipeptidase [Clostridia bacterium]